MPKGVLMWLILVAGSLLIIVGVSLMGAMSTTELERGAVEVKLEEGKTETLEFEDLALVPGEECEYTVKLEKSGASKYDVELDFIDIDEEKTLKDFARVKIIADDEIVCDELLADAFENDVIVLPVDFDEKKNTELKIVYYLPLEVGNEAKKAEAIFELLIKASNE